MGFSIVVHKQWSRGQSMVVKMRDDNSFQDIPLTSWLIEIALNCDQFHIAIMQKCIPTPSPPNGMLSWMLTSHTSSSISHTLPPDHAARFHLWHT